MTLAELLPHLVTLAVGLVGGGLLKARPERSQIYLLGAESSVKSLTAALAEADQDKAELRQALAEVRAELATEREARSALAVELAEERRCRTDLESRLSRLERAAD